MTEFGKERRGEKRRGDRIEDGRREEKTREGGENRRWIGEKRM